MARKHVDIIANLDDEETKRRLLVTVGTLRGAYDIRMKPVSPTRSNQANRFYFGVVVQSLMDFLHEQGEFLTKDQCHQIIAMKVAPEDVLNPITGEVIGIVPKSTSKMDSEVFSEYVDNAIAWLAEMFGIIVPEPASIGGKNVR